MTLSQLVAFNLALIAAVLSPGPALIYALKCNLGGGRAAGMLAGLGLATMAASWTLMALLGLGSVFKLFPTAFVAIKIAGAIYLMYIAWSTWRRASSAVEKTNDYQRRAFVDGFLVNLANPKSVLFAGAVLVVIFPAALTRAEMAIVVGNHWAVEVLAYSGLTLLLTSEAVTRRYLRAKKIFERGFAVLLGALGLRLLLDPSE